VKGIIKNSSLVESYYNQENSKMELVGSDSIIESKSTKQKNLNKESVNYCELGKDNKTVTFLETKKIHQGYPVDG
jgi:hypothetical protein